MTGYGEASSQSGGFRVAVAARSVNHRFLDVVLRMREPYRASEVRLRELVAKRLARGRVELQVEIAPLASREVSVRVRRDRIGTLLDELADVGADPRLDGGLRLGELLQVPGVLEVSESELPWGPADEAGLLEVGERALLALDAARAREGERLVAVLVDLLDRLAAMVAQLAARRLQVVAGLREQLRQRVAALVDGAPEAAGDRLELDPQRLEQEVALLADRSDVAEELARLDSHLADCQRTIARLEPGGRRLDFLAQEIARELNTVGAKNRDAALAGLVVDAKLVCEQLREQAQNLE